MPGNERTELTIRPITADDLPQLLELYGHLSPDDPPCSPTCAEDNFARFLRYDGNAILVGTKDHIFVTSCVLVVIPNLSRSGHPYALIENVVTHEDHRNRGYATHVLDAACDRAWAAGCYKVMLMTGSKRPETLRFYANAGFLQTKTGFQKRAPGY
ncbi:GNAT family N-acetyltransferase [Cognatiyoonia sp. IB215182]|uniref:GNAT family N-acetyltransferase n=1 Tax=Cognatiyoonia sp. IB215182 TaxID=3097353 RepID=UPI002A177FD3|nr:GNAT family N-acetyltransferase [Cognatiyoonia sp. IB215182]MDX8351144.1 GNAT family N-acetyltransferase [Cognatiyoonia sp. IB215182]